MMQYQTSKQDDKNEHGSWKMLKEDHKIKIVEMG